ncbi:uncharacterized protein LOC112044369 [Bicyclus anynana]|uniref:Uncharacterized protein LOC112044369 n=1 Tax=Bicyclus anynana TaxID=110368 RepID=A0ABM3LY16_BICAN|nr:uncharacterized protein LOC112044369 [Bicyclus anynana]
MTAVNPLSATRLPMPAFSSRAVLMYSAAVGGEGVALQLREATPAEIDERLALACAEPELLADLLHAAADIDGEHDGLTELLRTSPDLALASDASNSLPDYDHDHDNDCTTSSSSSLSGITRVSVAVTGIERPTAKKIRPKPASPNRQGPQQCQVCNKVFGNASALAKHKLTHSDERKYVCITCTKAFKRQDHLNGHMLTHRNKKPYECKADGCGKSYCDARSLRRHTENHHQPPPETKAASSTDSVDRDTNASRLPSPTSPPRASSTTSDSSSGSDKSGSHSGDNSPPRTPPAPPTPPARPKASKASSSKPKSNAITQQSSPKCGSGGSASGTSTSGTGPTRGNDVKQVECNLCHRKFKNIPALNGHMRLHGGYFKKDSDNKKLDKKESTGPPLQTASVSVRALIEEKIISRRCATVSSSPSIGTNTEITVTSRSGFVAPPPPPLSTIKSSPALTISPSSQFISPRAPPVVTVTPNVTITTSGGIAGARDSTLIELLKKGSSKVKRSASDPGQASPQQEFTFRPELFGVSFNSDDGYFSPALNEDTFQFTTTSDQLDELASLEDYASVAASIRERSPVTYPSSRRLAAVLNSPLPESLADFGACHGGSPVPSPGIGYSESSPGLSYTTGDSPGLTYAASSPSGSYSTHPEPSPGLAYPTPPASHDAHSPAHTLPRASSPLSAAFFTATMSSQEEVEEALEEVLPDECRSLDAYILEPTTARRIMLNSEDPLLSSSPRDFPHQRSIRRQQRLLAPVTTPLQQWTHDSLQVCVEGRDSLPAVFLSPSSVPASPQRRKRRASPAGPYRSRMRRMVNHYTPQPILAPYREGPGLIAEMLNGLQSDADVLSQMEEPHLPRINIGSDHQADLPELCNDRIDLHRAPEQLLWDPGINDALDDNEVRMFMELAMCAAMPVGGHTREFALQTLGECGGDIRAATLRLMSRPAAQSQHESRWTPDEVEAFLAGLSQFDKDFFRISQLVRTKDSKQCVQFYYFWKKVTKDYKTLYLRSWHDAQAPQGSVGQNSSVVSTCTSPSPSFEGEEFPCKICGKVFNKVKSRSAHMKSHRPLDAEPKRPKLEKPYEKVERSDDRSQATAEFQYKLPTQ